MAYPGQNSPELPDYYCGQLIWKEEGNSLAWCLYDGRQIDRFQTRELAERYALDRAGKLSDDAIGRLMQIKFRINSCNQALHRESILAPPPFNIYLEKVSAQLARQRDDLDDIIEKFIKNR